MNVHVLQHVPFEDIGSMESWLRARDAAIGYTRFHEAWELPGLEGLDLIIAMGGPMSVNDERELPWLIDEKRFVREAIERGIPVLGICLGAQLIASSLGGKVRPCPRKEIGWFDVEAVRTMGEHFRFPPRMEAFHWHGETFELPEGAVHLARSAACEHQAFQIGTHVIGLQFHLETTPETARLLVENCRSELVTGEFVQNEKAILKDSPERYLAINRAMESVLSYLSGD